MKSKIETFIEALKQKQEERGENQEQFAEFLGISQGALSKIYNRNMGVGKILPSILARYPNLSYFFALENDDRNLGKPVGISEHGGDRS